MPDFCSGRDVLDKLVTGLTHVKETSIAYLVSIKTTVSGVLLCFAAACTPFTAKK